MPSITINSNKDDKLLDHLSTTHIPSSDDNSNTNSTNYNEVSYYVYPNQKKNSCKRKESDIIFQDIQCIYVYVYVCMYILIYIN